MSGLLSSTFQEIAKNRWANRMAKRYGLRFGAQRFVAGETITDSMEAVRRLNQKGLMATLDHLGEFIAEPQEAMDAATSCVNILHAIAEHRLNANLSVKLTQLGLDISRDLCVENMERILDCANSYGNFVRIDMEDFSHCQPAIDLFKQLRSRYPNLGLVIQAYLYRSEEDIQDLQRLGANVRLVKGAYKESQTVSFPEKRDVDENYKKLAAQHLLSGCYTAIASHDPQMLSYVKELATTHTISRESFEFQMLYGIRTDLQKQLVSESYRTRVYVPFGNDWFGYFMRRLAERPANVWFVAKNMVRK